MTRLEDRTLLATYTVNSVADDGSDGTLRWAIDQANASNQADTIAFSNLFSTPQTITLGGTPLILTDAATTTLDGPGSGLLTIDGNQASGVFSIQGGAAAISGLAITRGLADRGGAVLNQGGTLTLTAATLTGNVGIDHGGAVATQFGGGTTLVDCTISGNSATNDAGGGVANLYNGSATLINCTISGNSAPTGGGLYTAGGSLTLTNSTVSGNTAATDGGGLAAVNAGTVTLTNTIVAGNTGGDVRGAVASTAANNLIGNGAGLTGITNGTQGNQIGTAATPVVPLLSALGSYGGPTRTLALLPGSPAIGGGTAAGAPANDQRGTPRTGRVDIGAFQSQGFIFTPVVGSTPQSAALATVFASPLAVTVTPNDPAEPVDGGVVRFAAPATGASATFSSPTGVVASGKAGVLATAAVAAGSYTVTASALGSTPAAFSMTNTPLYSLVVNTTKDLPLPLPGETSLRAAIAYAEVLTGTQVITFDPAVFGSTPRTIALDYGTFTILNPGKTTIQGPGAGLLTIDAGGKSRHFSVDGGSAEVSGLTLTGGRAEFGGAVYNDGGTLALTDCTITGNSATFGGGVASINGATTTLTGATVSNNSAATNGGGVFSNSGSLSLTGTTVSRNTSPYGGGVANLASGAVTVAGGTIGDNTSSRLGAGIYNTGPTLALTNATVSGNTTPGKGGGLFNNGGSLTLTGSTISGNTAYTSFQPSDGGGIYNQAGTVAATNCTISGNRTFQFGGGICNLGTLVMTSCTLDSNVVVNTTGGAINNKGTATLINCTITGNSAGGGGGLYISGPTTLINCTVTGNSGIVPGGIIVYSGPTTLINTIVSGNANGDLSGNITPNSSNNLIGGTPLLAPIGNYGGPTRTQALLPGSPAIGGGTATGAPTTDQRGKPRTGRVDIGAFQSQGFTLAPVAGSNEQSTPVNRPFANPLSVTVTANDPAEPVDGGVVRFAAPASGASATLSAATAIIAEGKARVTATANGTTGKYVVNASAAGAATIPFGLSNTEAAGPLVTAPHDIADAFDNLTTLREAIAYANGHPGPDTIVFDPAAFGGASRTITLVGGPLILTDPATTTIVGPGTRRLTIRGAGAGSVFEVRGAAAISGLTVSGGNAPVGGGVLNGGDAALTDVLVRGNRAVYGGGVANLGTIALRRVTLRGNRATVGGGLYNDGRAALAAVHVQNNATRLGGAVFNTRRATLAWRKPTPRTSG